MADAMRRERLPLFTLESWRPVREADLLGNHAAGRADVLERARGARPGRDPAARRRSRRGRSDRGRGRARARPTRRRWRRSSTPSSWASRSEAFEAVLDVIATVHSSRAARLAALAANPYLYLPGRGRHPVERAVYAEFGIETHPAESVVPYSSAIFSRASVEVMRGCTRGCRFCHAGTWYRPVRERPAERGGRGRARSSSAAPGYDELSLTSLATSDYTDVVPAIERHQARLPDAAPVAAVQPRRHGAGGADRRSERSPELDHAGARGGHAADARHHLQDDHRRDDRERDRGGVPGRVHQPQDVLHDRPAARDARRGAGDRRSRHPGARDRPKGATGGGRFNRCT